MTAEDTNVVTEGRETVRALARAIWAASQRPSEESEEAAGEEAKAAWEADKADMMRTAKKTLRRLEAKGFTLVQK